MTTLPSLGRKALLAQRFFVRSNDAHPSREHLAYFSTTFASRSLYDHHSTSVWSTAKPSLKKPCSPCSQLNLSNFSSSSSLVSSPISFQVRSFWSSSNASATVASSPTPTSTSSLPDSPSTTNTQPRRFFSILDGLLGRAESTEVSHHRAEKMKLKKGAVKGTVDVLQYDISGGKLERVLPKVELASELRIPGRDLRTVDNTQPMTTISIRDNAIMVNMENVKAIIQADRLIFFDSKNAAIQPLLGSIEDELKKTHPSDTTSYTGGDSVSSISVYDPTQVDPFEFRILENILDFVCQGLHEDYTSLRPKLEAIMHQPFNKKLSESLDLLYLYGEDLDQLYGRVMQVTEAITKVLDSDEDLALMYLTVRLQTGYPRRKDQHQEVELLLENYLSRVQTIGLHLQQLKKRIEKTEQHIRVAFASQRNHIMKLNLIFTMATVSLSLSSLGASVFGMNLRSGFELHPVAFYAVTGTLLCLAPAVFTGILYFLRKNHTI